MKLRTLSILTIGAMLLCAPLMAQTEEQEPYQDEPTIQEPAPDPQEGFEAEASAEAEVSSEPEVSADAELTAEAEVSTETEADLSESEPMDHELPQTAGLLPLLALLGLGAVGAALGLRRVRPSTK